MREEDFQEATYESLCEKGGRAPFFLSFILSSLAAIRLAKDAEGRSIGWVHPLKIIIICSQSKWHKTNMSISWDRRY